MSSRATGSGGEASSGDVPMKYHILRAALNRYAKPPARLDHEQRSQVLAQAQRTHAIEARVLASDQARDVVISPESVDAALHSIEQRYPERDEFLGELALNDMDETELRAALARELTVDAVLERVGARAAQISDIDAMLYYYLHKDKFERPETRTARHILITINPDFAENTREAALARCTQIQRRVQRKPHRFGEQAMKHSECPTAMQEGVLGRIPRGQLFEALDAVLFALPEGGVSEVIESPLGFHIVYCETIHPCGAVPVKEALPQVREKLMQRRRRMCQRAWLADLDGESALE